MATVPAMVLLDEACSITSENNGGEREQSSLYKEGPEDREEAVAGTSKREGT